MLIIENELVPDFDNKMESVSKTTNSKYLNTMPLRNNYSYIDGHHLDTTSSKAFSLYIAAQIKQLQKIN